MSYSISRSSRNRNLFVLVSGNKESEMEFPFKEGALHRRNASRFTKWIPRNTANKNKNQVADDITQSQMDFYGEAVF